MRLSWIPVAAAAALTACDPAPAPPESAPVPDTVATDTGLRDELLRLGMLDQTARIGLAAGFGTDTGMARATLAIDSILTRRLRRIVEEHGWPRWSLVGRDAGQAAFLIVQHSPIDGFQRMMLDTLEVAAAAGQASPADVAMLTDRLLTHDGVPQRFGTQFRIVGEALVPFPIEDMPNLERRRAAAGLPSMAEYVKLLRQTYRGPVLWPVRPPSPTGPDRTVGDSVGP